MPAAFSRFLALATALLLATVVTLPVDSLTGLGIAAPGDPGPPPPVGTHTGSFLRGTITVKVSGSRGGIQTGPFTNLTFTEGERGKTLSIRLDQVSSVGGDEDLQSPMHLYRSLVGPRRAGDEVIAFSEPPVRQAEEVAADRTRGALVWSIEPGDYFVFLPRTRPIVQVPQKFQPSSASYTVVME